MAAENGSRDPEEKPTRVRRKAVVAGLRKSVPKSQADAGSWSCFVLLSRLETPPASFQTKAGVSKFALF